MAFQTEDLFLIWEIKKRKKKEWNEKINKENLKEKLQPPKFSLANQKIPFRLRAWLCMKSKRAF